MKPIRKYKTERVARAAAGHITSRYRNVVRVSTEPHPDGDGFAAKMHLTNKQVLYIRER